MKSIKYILTMLLLLTGSIAFAQSSIEYNMQQRVRQKVAQLNDNISFMADKSKSVNTRQYYRKRALSLFIAQGEPFEEEGIQNSGAKMETTSVYRKKPTRRLMKDYFTGLIQLRYSKVSIKTTKLHDIEVSKLQKIGENMYVCTACFEQFFLGYDADGNPIYSDRTRKKVKVYVFLDETIDNPELMVFLGDITALETRKI